jgi:hypothetical protein
VSATIRQIIDAALTVVGEVTGPGVQTYEEPRMLDDAVRAFNMMFKKYTWEQYLKWFTVTLDGVTGQITTNAFTQVLDFEDFIGVHRAGEDGRLPIAPKRVNPFSLSVGGTQVLYWTSLNALDPNYEGRKLQFYPLASIGNVDVLARVYPAGTGTEGALTFEDTLYLDKDMLVYATAFMTLSGDDLNVGAADVVRNLMEMKFRDITAQLANHPLPVYSDVNIPRHWQEHP